MEKVYDKIYARGEEEKAHQDILEKLKQMLSGSKGYVIVALVNKNDEPCLLDACGGKLSTEMLADLLAKTMTFTKKVAQMSLRLKGEECQCPKCQAKRMEHKPSSNFVH